jgi:uncharacterized protein YkwD
MKPRLLIAVLALGLLVSAAISVPRAALAVDPPVEVLLPPAVYDGDTPISPCYAGCGGPIAPLIDASYEQEVVYLVNLERNARGLPPLKRVTELENAARYHATDMGQDNYFAHDTYDRVGGSLVKVCDPWTRIKAYYPSPYAENAAAGYTTPQSVMNGWMNSEGHKDNILSTGSWEIGVGYYAGGGDYFRYWVQNFGRRDGVYPLTINREAIATESRNVSLYIYGTWDEVRLRNDDGAWSSWLPFQNTMSWTLGTGRGEHTVWAEMRKSGQSASSSDAIYLDVSLPSLDNLPDAIRFTYSIPDQRLVPASAQVTPRNESSDDPLAWHITSAGSWFGVSPLDGTTPGSFWVTPAGFGTGTEATYTGLVTVTATSPADVQGSPQAIDVMLRVVDAPIVDVYLPLVYKNH